MGDVGGAIRKRGAMAVVAGIVVMLVGGLQGGPAYARREGKPPGSPSPSQGQSREELYGCDRTFGRPPEGHLEKSTEPAGDHDVRPGKTIRVTLVWEPGDWSSDELHKVLDCVAIDGRLERSMQGGESPTANDGRFTRDYAVPDSAPEGARICDQAMLSGPSPRGDYDRQISNQVCHTVSRSSPCCQGGNRCGECRHEAPCGDCGSRPPCDDRPCGDRPPCGNNPCGHAPPSCGRGCGDKGAACSEKSRCGDKAPCGEKPRCDGDRKRPGGKNRDRRDCGCDGRERRHRGLVSRLIHELL